ncbi:MAG: hypothetical protein J4F29_18125 [Candidatus Latescibacteria bacterium]|nr:hypothetical protein [Candidatus Latescibacterota bacterium]
MKPEYDFSRAERGKFYREGAEIRLPIYLNAKLQHRLEQVAKKRGKDLGEVVNQILTEEVDIAVSSATYKRI